MTSQQEHVHFQSRKRWLCSRFCQKSLFKKSSNSLVHLRFSDNMSILMHHFLSRVAIISNFLHLGVNQVQRGNFFLKKHWCHRDLPPPSGSDQTASTQPDKHNCFLFWFVTSHHLQSTHLHLTHFLMTWVDFSTTLAFTVLIPSQFLPQISFNDDEEISFRKQHGDNCLPTCTYSKATKQTESIGGTMSKSWPHTDIINGIVVCLNEHFCTNWIISKTAWLKWQCDCFCDCKTLGFLVRVRERMVCNEYFCFFLYVDVVPLVCICWLYQKFSQLKWTFN